MALDLLGTREQKENEAGITGEQRLSRFDMLGIREHRNRKITFRKKRNTRKILLGTRKHGPLLGDSQANAAEVRISRIEKSFVVIVH